jgi:hypothetical protein
MEGIFLKVSNLAELKEEIVRLCKTEGDHKRAITLSFERCYGKCGEPIDEDTWLRWYTIWVSAWNEAMAHFRQEMERAQE